MNVHAVTNRGLDARPKSEVSGGVANAPHRSVTVAFDSTNPGAWAFHCQHLYHRAAGMMSAVKYEA